MNNEERKIFWDTLCTTHGNSPEEISRLCDAVNRPKYLCRYRSVNENSLLQLQENKLYYSSADYYDDPFDTYIHINYDQLNKSYFYLSNGINNDNPILRGMIKAYEPYIGIDADRFIKILKENPLDLQNLEGQMKYIRTIIQKRLFSICFCEDELNESLWLKYANNYKGFALVYDMDSCNTYLSGREDKCKDCISLRDQPSVYPVYYSDDSYDATRYAFACLLWANTNTPKEVFDLSIRLTMWDAERISLIKKKCHEYDYEWRMLHPFMVYERPCIKMKPCRIVLGLRMLQSERNLVVSAAKIAGIDEIEELVIGPDDQLTCRRI